MSENEKSPVLVDAKIWLAAVNEALEQRIREAEQVRPDALARARELREAGDETKADYWLTKALGLNTKRGVDQVRRHAATKARR